MSSRKIWLVGLIVIVTATLALGAARTCEKLHWVGEEPDIEGAEHFDVSDLADGETRTFGGGEHTVVATRDGDEVTLTLPGEKAGEHSVECTVGEDRCLVLVRGEGDDGPAVLAIRKTGGGDEEKHVDMEILTHAGHADAEGKTAIFIGGEGKEGVHVREMTKEILLDGEKGVRVLRLHEGGNLRLRCPEGDTTMVLDEEDAGETFHCPKHGLPLEEVEEMEIHKVIRVIRSSEEEEE